MYSSIDNNGGLAVAVFDSDSSSVYVIHLSLDLKSITLS